MRRFILAVIVSLLAGPLTHGMAAQVVTPPEQPAAFTDGRVYLHDEITGQRYGEQPTGYWLFEPEGVGVDDPAHGIVILLHGYTATDPDYLGDWIEHIVRQGRVVIFPDYQVDNPLGVPPLEYTGNMIDGVRAALDELATGDHPPTQLDNLAVAGYSMGGVLALNYAAMADGLGLPVPTVVMAVTPGGCIGCGGSGRDDFGVPYRDLGRIDPSTKLLLAVGEDDDFVGRRPAEVAWEQTGHIADADRDLLIARSDRHGQPGLLADHSFPSNGGDQAEVDALDWFGTWQWLDGLMQCDADERACGEWMNGGALQVDMGTWSDGQAVLSPLVVESL